MRILLCTKRDLAGAIVLNQLMPHLAADHVMVLLSDKTRPTEKSLAELSEMKFLERDLPIDTLFPLVDSLDAEGAPLATFNGIAARYGVPMKTVDNINSADSEALIRDFAPDLILSVRFSLIFKQPVFDIPRLGTWNVHPGALPRYAGLFAPFRSMLDGQSHMGCTLHRIDDGIDTGPVVGIGWLPVERRRSLLWHVVRAYQPGLDLFVTMLDGMRQGREPELRAQDSGLRVYVSMPDEAQFRAFHANGLRLSDPAEYQDIIRGFLPPDFDVPDAVLAALEPSTGAAFDKVGASCCCAHA